MVNTMGWNERSDPDMRTANFCDVYREGVYRHINMSVWLGTLDSHIISYLNLDIYLDMIKYIFIKVFALVISGHK